MKDHDRRIYVQMAPDEASRQELREISENLPLQLSGRRLPESELHVTLIHFGKVQDVLAAIRSVVKIGDRAYREQLDHYVASTSDLLTDDTYNLHATGYERFGVRHSTLVARYEAPPELHEIHANAYQELLHFLGRCGIQSAAEFAKNDPNFMFAGTFTPHLTLYKSYNGPSPYQSAPDIVVRFMPLEYDARKPK